MWNDEDNNPYGSFDQRGAPEAGNRQPSYSYHPYEQDHESPKLAASEPAGAYRPTGPGSDDESSNNDPPDFLSQPTETEDADQEAEDNPPKKGYRSRVEQILADNPEMPIVITDAGKNAESGGGYIVYTIKTGDLFVRRRYSEFNSLRATLVKLHPTLIIPPIPEKHTMSDYAAAPTKAKEDVGIIDLRKRMLGVFLNRCRRMREVREDDVWWRFLDPNASWSEVLNSPPVSTLPKNILKAPPKDPANADPAHDWLPVPASSAKLKSGGSSQSTPSSSQAVTSPTSPVATTVTGVLINNRFPSKTATLSEDELDPYFANFEAATRELELLLQGSIEKVNRRTLSHMSTLAADFYELGARYNGFSLSEQSPTLAAAIERIGQAADSSYRATEELSSSLGANFAEPMRESAQFASVVRSVLRYRMLKRVQEEMTVSELEKKTSLLESLERSEMEARRIDSYLNNTGQASSPRRSNSSSSPRISHKRDASLDDNASIDSDFPPTHGGGSSPPSAAQGKPVKDDAPTSSPSHKKSSSGNFVTNKLFGRITHAVHGIVDVDPERTRRDQIGKTKESLVQLERALVVSRKDVKEASSGVMKDIMRFQKEKEDDLKRYMIAYARCHIEWAKQNTAIWEEAKEEVGKIESR